MIVHFISEHESRVKTVNFDVCKNRPKLIGYHSNILGLLRNLCQFYNSHIYAYQCWNIGKDWFSSCWDIRQYRPISAESQHNFHFLLHFNSNTTEPIFTIFSHNVEKLVELSMLVYAMRYPIPFRNDRVISASGVCNFARILLQNWLPWQRPLRYWKKFRSVICTKNAFIWCKNYKNCTWFLFCLPHKIGCHDNVAWESEKLDLIEKIHANTFHLVKRSLKSVQ